ARAAARRHRTSAAPGCAAGAGTARTARPGSGTRARTGSAPGRAYRRRRSCLAAFAFQLRGDERGQRGVDLLVGDALAQAEVAGGVADLALLDRRDPLAGVARRGEARALQQHALALHQLEIELAVGVAVLLERRQRGVRDLLRRFRLDGRDPRQVAQARSEEHTSELQSREKLVCRL